MNGLPDLGGLIEGPGSDGHVGLFRAAQAQPMLSREEEAELARLSVTGDAAAAARLVASHLRFVIRIARGYRNYGLPMNDLVQEGVVGLMQAVRKFNPDREVRFATYAMWWIRAAIQEHVVRSWSMVRLGTTATQRALFFNLRRKMVELMDSADAWSEDVLGPLAKRFRMPLKDAVSVALRAAGRDQSLNQPISGDSGEEWVERLADGRPNPEEIAAADSETSFWSGLLERAIEMLPPREQVIIHERFLAEAVKTREAIGGQLGISKERVRQLEAHALERLREILLPARTGA
ncbi:MAG: RNA polymerase factor sigma-32 [Alphaproteobacteria bacterium]|nr:RNA polymerase factor sigma-32 [Alphaproteobacteria bacterium]